MVKPFDFKRYSPWAPWFFGVTTLLLALSLHLSFALEGWDHTIGGPQDFRQSQTAITAYYIDKEGPALATIDPVLGPDWRIPFEFPTYQTLVAGLHRVTGIPLDQSGRLVSLLSFYLCLIPLALLLRELGFDGPFTLLTLALVTASPTYIFWSRCFLIEGTALFLALSFATACLAWLRRPRWYLLLAALILGPLAAVTKFTTFSILFGFMVLWVSVRVFLARDQPSRRQWITLGVFLGLPILAGLVWNAYIHSIWVQSPLTRYFAEGISQWNFGSLEQRLSADFWSRFHESGVGRLVYSAIPLLVTFLAYLVSPARWKLIGLCLLGAWLSGPIVWANLYYVHDYYYYATAAFGLAWIAGTMAALARRWGNLRLPLQLALAGLCLWMISRYEETSYYEAQVNDWGGYKFAFSREVGALTAAGDVVLILGDSWSPFIPYYAERYAIMQRWPGQSWSPGFQEAISRSEAEGRPVSAAVYTDDPAYANDRAFLTRKFNLDPEPAAVSEDGRFFLHLQKPKED